MPRFSREIISNDEKFKMQSAVDLGQNLTTHGIQLLMDIFPTKKLCNVLAVQNCSIGGLLFVRWLGPNNNQSLHNTTIL